MPRLTLPTLLLFLALALPLHAQTTPRPYTQLYIFGDSYSDTGAGYLFSNGPTAVAYLAQRLAIPFTYYGAPDAKGKGLNFSVSGAKTGEGPGIRYPHGELLGLGMKNQVDEFAALLKSGDLHFDPAQTMFFLAGGLNDRGTPLGYTRANLDSLIDTLYALGARRFQVALLPTQIPAFASAGTQFNPDIAQVPADERSKHPGIRIANSTWGANFDEVITHPAKYGLTDTTTPCATGRALLGGDPTPCASPSTHFFYNPGHPSTAAHKAVGDLLYDEAIHNAP
jgi:phospholipase/lecithinase/hemolysin